MTVACEDKSIDVHKLVLSANSSFFRKILNKSKDTHSYIYIRGLVYQDLVSMINFMYQGEIKVPGENLSRFITAAQELDIRGLGHDQIKGANLQRCSVANYLQRSTLSNTSVKSLNISNVSSIKPRSSSTLNSRNTLEVVKEIDEKKDLDEPNDSNLYEIVGAEEENVMNCSFGSELSKISQRMNKMKQLKIQNIKRIKHSLNDNYNPNDTLDSVIPNAEDDIQDTFDEEMGEDEAEMSTDSAMIIDGSSASDQNAQLELEISMRMTKIRYQIFCLYLLIDF